jgi:hypothetical protein
MNNLITFDFDGTLCKFVSAVKHFEEEWTLPTPFQTPPIGALGELAACPKLDFAIVSARGDTQSMLEWMRYWHVDAQLFQFIVGCNGKERKLEVLQKLQPLLHFDDHSFITARLPGSVLVRNPVYHAGMQWPPHERAIDYNWAAMKRRIDEEDRARYGELKQDPLVLQ